MQNQSASKTSVLETETLVSLVFSPTESFLLRREDSIGSIANQSLNPQKISANQTTLLLDANATHSTDRLANQQPHKMAAKFSCKYRENLYGHIKFAI